MNNTKPKILIGLVGFSSAGKNHTAALLQNYLQLNHDITAPTIAFADPLKELTHSLFPDLSEDKSEPETRIAYQRTGSALRHFLTSFVFINALDYSIHEYEYPNVHIITDVRYMNEIEYILKENPHNHVIHVTRPGNEPYNTHRSELDHLQMVLPTGRYYSDRILNYENTDNASPEKVFNYLSKKMFIQKPKRGEEGA